jgi:hypothetical protein
MVFLPSFTQLVVWEHSDKLSYKTGMRRLHFPPTDRVAIFA